MQTSELSDAGTRTTVVGAGASYTFAGLPLSDLVAIATLLYIVFQIIVLTPKVWAVLTKFRKTETDD